VARTAVVSDWLQRHAMTASGTGWAKFQREATPIIQTRTSTVDIRLADAANADAFGAVVQAGFGLPADTAKWFAALSGRPGWKLYLAYEGETPVASGAAFASQGVAWFGIDATLADHRRRGAQTTLIHRRIEDGRGAGLTGFTAETGRPAAGEEPAHTSYSNYRRAGFTPAYARANYKRAS
jgi:GNAT superfamily N-acetyltransferase